MTPRRIWLPTVALLLVMAAACGKAAAPGSSPTPTPTTGGPKSLPALKLAVLAAVGGHLSYCDPDQYPVAHLNQLEAAQARISTIEADRTTFDAILSYLNLPLGQSSFTAQQLIAINDAYKQILAIQLQPAGDGYRFDVQVPQKGSDVGIQRLVGTVSRTGQVAIEQREPGHRLPCPICLAAGVLIATPSGNVPIQDLTAGMPVWTTDRHGRRVEGVVLATGFMQAPLGHEVVRIELADGRTVTVSPGHLTADGRTVGELQVGDTYDGSVVVSAALFPYTGFTYDLLPSGPTGTYYAGGVLLGSTLSAPVVRTTRLPR